MAHRNTSREALMEQDRREFLKTTSLAGAAAAMTGATTLTVTPAQAQTSTQAMARGLTLATLRRADGGYGLGLRTDRGILDVIAAETDFHENAPATITQVLNREGDASGLRRLAAKANAQAARHFGAEDRAQLRPCVTNPEKIVCVGLNYRKHAAETGNPVPKMPILFNKYNTALNCHGGKIAVSKEKAEKFDYEAELVIVMGKQARNVSEADAKSHIFGYCTGN